MYVSFLPCVHSDGDWQTAWPGPRSPDIRGWLTRTTGLGTILSPRNRRLRTYMFETDRGRLGSTEQKRLTWHIHIVGTIIFCREILSRENMFKKSERIYEHVFYIEHKQTRMHANYQRCTCSCCTFQSKTDDICCNSWKVETAPNTNRPSGWLFWFTVVSFHVAFLILFFWYDSLESDFRIVLSDSDDLMILLCIIRIEDRFW